MYRYRLTNNSKLCMKAVSTCAIIVIRTVQCMGLPLSLVKVHIEIRVFLNYSAMCTLTQTHTPWTMMSGFGWAASLRLSGSNSPTSK